MFSPANINYNHLRVSLFYFISAKQPTMKKMNLFAILLLANFCAFSQYKNDNVLFKTVYTQDLCSELNKHAQYLLLDVRTPGEYADTSSMGLNLGRFRGAINVEVSELGSRIHELDDYKNIPVFVYCSHSQRSRRASKMLADSGFKQVYNINGGMTGLRQLPANGYQCMADKLESANEYAIISTADLCNKLASQPGDIFLLDVRPDSAFRHISSNAKLNAYGYFRNTVNIPLSELEKNLRKVPTGKEIIITDLFGGDAARAAAFLKQNNYTNVSILPEGIDRILYSEDKSTSCFPTAYVSDAPFRMINSVELKRFVESNSDYLFLDIRMVEEFTNKHKNSWQNIGHLDKAVNIPASDLEAQWNKIENYRTRPVIVYAFSSSTPVYESANLLVQKGFTNVMVLQGGLFSVGWTAANIKGCSSLASLRVDIPAENQ